MINVFSAAGATNKAPRYFVCRTSALTRPLFRCVAALVLGVALAACATRSHEVDDAALRAADGDGTNWITYGRTYSEQRFSTLRQINDTTVNRLGLAWTFDLGTLRAVEATPLVNDGVMYITSAWSLVYAFDARTGRLLWTFDPHVPKDHAKFVCCDVVNRGVALYRHTVFVGTLDGRLIALDARTGSPRWDVHTTPKGSPYAITGAPRVVKGRVIIGNAGAEYAVRGYVSAYDADTGGLVWRTYTVPGDPSQPFESESLRRAAATWSGPWWKAGGGGNPWDTIVYDPTLDLVYFGTGNGSPWYERLRSEGHGDNLYISSIIAVRSATGEQVWHYQTTPGDNWDYDATQPLMLATLKMDGGPRRVLMQANKNGFFYVLDAATGALVSARPYAKTTWASGVDANGRPIEGEDARRVEDAAVVWPGTDGAHNWNPLSFNPDTGFVYFGVTDAPTAHAADLQWTSNLHDQSIGRNARYRGPALTQAAGAAISGRLVAWDPAAGREAWRVEFALPRSGGTLSTAGNLVFQGRADGKLLAYDAKNGRQLWQFDAGVGIGAPPMTYAIDGRQFVAVLAGWGGPMVLTNRPAGRGRVGFGQLLVFALDQSGTLPRYERSIGPVIAPEFRLLASRSDVEEGASLYNTYCFRCHGVDVVSGGSVPDLRYMQESTHAAFESIVRGGERRMFGMPSFADDLTGDDVRRVHAYVIERARQSASTSTPSSER